MRILTGTAVRTKMQKTVVVSVERRRVHPKYGKSVRVTKKYYAHDPESRVKEGDAINILEVRPLSKLKRWLVITPERAATLKAARAADSTTAA